VSSDPLRKDVADLLIHPRIWDRRKVMKANVHQLIGGEKRDAKVENKNIRRLSRKGAENNTNPCSQTPISEKGN